MTWTYIYSKNHVKDTRKTNKTVKDASVSALRDRPNSPPNIIKSHFNGLETARDVSKSRPIIIKPGSIYTCSSLTSFPLILAFTIYIVVM